MGPLYNPVGYPLMKIYVHYDDAWWRNDLGLVSGTFHNFDVIDPSADRSENIPDVEPAPLQGQYHDGDVRCDLPGGRCRGFLQAFYGGNLVSKGSNAIGGAIDFYDVFTDATVRDAATQITPTEPHHA